MSGLTISDIPYEVLLYIFTTAAVSPFSGPPRWRTSTGEIPINLAPKPIVEQSANYRPFSIKPFSVRSDEWAQTVQESLDTKRTIVLVCKEWMKLGTELLYEAIRIEHGSEALFNALNGGIQSQQSSLNGEDTFRLARLVKRAEISTNLADIDPFNPSLVWRILRSCPNLTTVVIPSLKGLHLGRARWADANENFASPDNPLKNPLFPNLTKIECCIPQTGAPTSRTEVNHNLSGLLEQVLDHAPKLQHMTITGGRWVHNYAPYEPILAKSFTFSSLTSLRVEADVEALFEAQPRLILQFPKLSRLIVGGAVGVVGPILAVCGKQITVLEMLDTFPNRSALRFHEPTERPRELTVANILEACPNLQELNINFLWAEMKIYDENQPKKIILPHLLCINVNRQTDTGHNAQICITKFGDWFANHLEARYLEKVVFSGHGGESEAWRWEPLVQKIKSKFDSVRIEMV